MSTRFPTTLTAVAIAGALLALLDGCAKPAPDNGLLTSVGVKDARDLLTQAGAKVEKTEFTPDGFAVTASVGVDQPVWFGGLNCKGAADAMTCTEYKIVAGWEIDTPARATALAGQMNYNYTSAFAEGKSINLTRMEFAYGGITREHLRRTLQEFLDLRQKAQALVTPPKTAAAPAMSTTPRFQ
jgi:hypothetical protein